MKKGIFILGLFYMLAVSSLYAKEAEKKPYEKLKNVIVIIPDGMSHAGVTLTRLFNGKPLTADSLVVGLMSTWSSDGTVADSAPAGSAIATGWKSQSGYIATMGEKYIWPTARKPKNDEIYRPVATLLEAAKLSGRATGIVSTSEFMHATPADFSAHDVSRKNYDNLAEQIVYNGLNVILGGGIKYLKPDIRKDNENLTAILQARGYEIVRNSMELNDFNGIKLVGVFGKTDEHTAISYDIERDPIREPSLAQMTKKAIEILSKNKNGFFLMVESSKVDWAAHANDPVGIISEINAFDNALAVAVNFAKQNGETLIIAMSDHGNSGISIGDRSTSKNYDKTLWVDLVGPLKKAKLTGEGFEALLPADRKKATVASMGNQIRLLSQKWLAVNDLTDEEIETILRAQKGQVNYAVGPILAKRAKIGFTTNGHTGEDVVIYSYDPRGRLLSGVLDNTEVAQFIATSLHLNLDETTEHLFKSAYFAFKNKQAKVRVDNKDAENPVLIVKKGNQELHIPRNKSVVWLNKQEVESDGVNVLSGEQWFVSQKVINLIH